MIKKIKMVQYASAYNKPIALYKNNSINGIPTNILMKTPIYGIKPNSPMTSIKTNAII